MYPGDSSASPREHAPAGRTGGHSRGPSSTVEAIIGQKSKTARRHQQVIDRLDQSVAAQREMIEVLRATHDLLRAPSAGGLEQRTTSSELDELCAAQERVHEQLESLLVGVREVHEAVRASSLEATRARLDNLIAAQERTNRLLELALQAAFDDAEDAPPGH